MCDTVAPAIPDYNWTHATDGYVDKDGYAIVIVQVLAPVRGTGGSWLLNKTFVRRLIYGSQDKRGWTS